MDAKSTDCILIFSSCKIETSCCTLRNEDFFLLNSKHEKRFFFTLAAAVAVVMFNVKRASILIHDTLKHKNSMSQNNNFYGNCGWFWLYYTLFSVRALTLSQGGKRKTFIAFMHTRDYWFLNIFPFNISNKNVAIIIIIKYHVRREVKKASSSIKCLLSSFSLKEMWYGFSILVIFPHLLPMFNYMFCE